MTVVISVEGLIAAGKSTALARLSRERGIPVLPEEVDVWCDWCGTNLLETAYQGDSADVLRLQLCAAYTRTQALREVREAAAAAAARGEAPERVVVMERCTESSVECFGACNHHAGNMSQADYQLQRATVTVMPDDCIRPDAVVYIDCAPTTAMERLAARARGEESAVALDYMQRLATEHERWLGDLDDVGVPVVRVNGALDTDALGAAVEAAIETAVNAVAEKQAAAHDATDDQAKQHGSSSF
jgi:deoxyadenosine/deoxycytidine kinase